MFLSLRDLSGSRGLLQAAWDGCRGLGQLGIGLVDVVVSVADVLVGSGRTPMLAWFSTRLEREVGGPGRLGRLVD